MNGEKFVEIVRRGSVESVKETISESGPVHINFRDKSTLRTALHYAAGKFIVNSI